MLYDQLLAAQSKTASVHRAKGLSPIAEPPFLLWCLLAWL